MSDTVLALLDGATCGGAELGCNDDDGALLSSQLTLELAAGQTVTAVVESWDEEPGEVSLTVSSGVPEAQPASCEPLALGGEPPLRVSGEFGSGAGALEPSCALFGSQSEAVYAFVAPASGTYRFDTGGSQADTILQVLDGSCGGAELACSDDTDSGELAAQLDLSLEEGQAS